MSLRTPIGRVLGLGSARDGTGHFMAQRISAVALALLGSWFVAALASLDSLTYLDVIRFAAGPVNGVLLVLFGLTASYHSYLGVQVVIEDYVHGPGAKLAALIASRFVHALAAAVAVYSILRIGFDT
jgi:succinate dehydrogenase / fumarate reductase membrane anchor subunit